MEAERGKRAKKEKGLKVTAAEVEEKKRQVQEEALEERKKKRLAEEEEKKNIKVMVDALMKKKSLEMRAEENPKRERIDTKPAGMTGPGLPPSLWPQKQILERRSAFWTDQSIESLDKLLSGQVQNDSEICKTLQDYRDEYRSNFVPDVDLSQLRELKSMDHSGSFVGNFAVKWDSFYVTECSHQHSLGIGGDVRSLEILADDDSLLFILIVPSEGFILHHLSRALVHVRFRCIIMCSCASPKQPDLPTRLFLKYLHVYLKLPVMALGHCDLEWLQALSVYAQGMPRDSVALGIPDIKWLRLRPRNLNTDGISGNIMGDISSIEAREARDILRNKTLRNQVLHHELDYMYTTRRNVIADLELLTLLGGSVSELYLPLKLQNKDWLDLKTGIVGR